MKFTLKNVRLSFPNLFVATTMGTDAKEKPAFNAAFLIDPTDPQVAELNKAMDAAGREKWGDKAAATLKALRAADKVCLRSGDLKAQYQGYEGMLYVSARSAARPTVLNSDKTPLTEQDGKPYSGCYVNAVLDIYAQDNSFGKRINASLMGVQFARDGDAFSGGRPASTDDFDDLSDGAGAGGIA